MNIIVGTTGQVGSHLIKRLSEKGIPSIALVRNPEKIKDSNLKFRHADLFDTEQVIKSFEGISTAFLLTPENPGSNNIIGETKQIIENYKKAVKANRVKRIVCLSCVGAHNEGETGNILMSRHLEQSFHDLDIEKVYVRPSYYFSNWLGYFNTVKQYGILPTFFPENLKIAMHSPLDLAEFLADTIAKPLQEKTTKIYELVGQEKYSSLDIAKAYSILVGKDIFVQSISNDKWKETLLSVGFTDNTADNLIDMTQAVIDGLTVPEFPNETIILKTTISEYLKQQLEK